MARKEKNIWILVLFLLAGLVVGGLIGELTAGVNGLRMANIWTRVWA